MDRENPTVDEVAAYLAVHPMATANWFGPTGRAARATWIDRDGTGWKVWDTDERGAEIDYMTLCTASSPRLSTHSCAGPSIIGMPTRQRPVDREGASHERRRRGMMARRFRADDSGREPIPPGAASSRLVVRDHSKDPPGGRAYVAGTRSLRSVVHHSAGLHFSQVRPWLGRAAVRGAGQADLGDSPDAIRS